MDLRALCSELLPENGKACCSMTFLFPFDIPALQICLDIVLFNGGQLFA